MAYIDPGSGSMLIQVLISVLVGGWFVFRSTVSDVFRRLTGQARKTPTGATDDPATDGTAADGETTPPSSE